MLKMLRMSHYSSCAKECTRIEKCATKHGPAKAVHYFLHLLNDLIPNSTISKKSMDNRPFYFSELVFYSY